jgi:hypothetical protein
VCKLCRLDDVVIAGTAAEIRRERVSDLCVRRVWVIAQECRQRHQKTRSAETTLEAVRLTKGRLKRIQISGRSKTLDGLEIVSGGLNREHDARADRFCIEQNGAGAAHAVLAPDMRARKTELLPDEIAEEQARLNVTVVANAVDGDGDFHPEILHH